MDPASLIALAMGVAAGAASSSSSVTEEDRLARTRFEWAWEVYLRMQPDWAPRTPEELVEADSRIEQGLLPPNWRPLTGVGAHGIRWKVVSDGGFLHWEEGQDALAYIDIHSMTVSRPWSGSPLAVRFDLLHRFLGSREEQLPFVIRSAQNLLNELEHGDDFKRFRNVSPELTNGIVALKAFLDRPTEIFFWPGE